MYAFCVFNNRRAVAVLLLFKKIILIKQKHYCKIHSLVWRHSYKDLNMFLIGRKMHII